MYFVRGLIAVLLCTSQLTWAIPADRPDPHPYQLDLPVTNIPSPDGYLHVYAMPVGQGDAHVVQCPNGDLSIVDMGTSDGVAQGFWHNTEITAFLQGNFNRIRSVILTHNHADHSSFLGSVLDPTKVDLSGLQRFYSSCTYNDLAAATKTWVDKIGVSKLSLFNNGGACGPNGVSCGTINLCPSNSAVTTIVLGANLGQQCSGSNKNIDSIVFKVSYGSFSVIFNGDFEDFTSNNSENGPQKQLIDYWGTTMRATVYKLSHHGAENLANKPMSQSAHAPKAVFASGNSWYSYQHPRCNIIDGFINTVKSLCQPESNCGTHPYGSLPVTRRVQRTYTCGLLGGGLRQVTNNAWAVFTTVPIQTQMNLIDLVATSSGTWGFVNNYQDKIVRDVDAPDNK